MKYVTAIAAWLLGLLFIASGVVFIFNLVKIPPSPENSPAAHLMLAMMPTGYMFLIKIFELIGGILVLIPRFRNFGLLILGPIIVNILATVILVMKGEGLAGPPLFVALLALYLLWVDRKEFARLAR